MNIILTAFLKNLAKLQRIEIGQEFSITSRLLAFRTGQTRAHFQRLENLQN